MIKEGKSRRGARRRRRQNSSQGARQRAPKKAPPKKAPPKKAPAKAPPKKPAAKPAARKRPAGARARGQEARLVAEPHRETQTRRPARAGASAGGPGDARRNWARDVRRERPRAAAAKKERGLFSFSSVAKAKTDAARQAGKFKSIKPLPARNRGANHPVTANETEDPADANDVQSVDASATSLWGRTRDILRGATAFATDTPVSSPKSRKTRSRSCSTAWTSRATGPFRCRKPSRRSAVREVRRRPRRSSK